MDFVNRGRGFTAGDTGLPLPPTGPASDRRRREAAHRPRRSYSPLPAACTSTPSASTSASTSTSTSLLPSAGPPIRLFDSHPTPSSSSTSSTYPTRPRQIRSRSPPSGPAAAASALAGLTGNGNTANGVLPSQSVGQRRDTGWGDRVARPGLAGPAGPAGDERPRSERGRNSQRLGERTRSKDRDRHREREKTDSRPERERDSRSRDRERKSHRERRKEREKEGGERSSRSRRSSRERSERPREKDRDKDKEDGRHRDRSRPPRERPREDRSSRNTSVEKGDQLWSPAASLSLSKGADRDSVGGFGNGVGRSRLPESIGGVGGGGSNASTPSGFQIPYLSRSSRKRTRTHDDDDDDNREGGREAYDGEDDRSSARGRRSRTESRAGSRQASPENERGRGRREDRENERGGERRRPTLLGSGSRGRREGEKGKSYYPTLRFGDDSSRLPSDHFSYQSKSRRPSTSLLDRLSAAPYDRERDNDSPSSSRRPYRRSPSPVPANAIDERDQRRSSFSSSAPATSLMRVAASASLFSSSRSPSFVNGVPIPASLPRRPGSLPQTVPRRPSGVTVRSLPNSRGSSALPVSSRFPALISAIPTGPAALRAGTPPRRERTQTPPLPPSAEKERLTLLQDRAPLARSREEDEEMEEGEEREEGEETEYEEGELKPSPRSPVATHDARSPSPSYTPPLPSRPLPTAAPVQKVEEDDDVDMFALQPEPKTDSHPASTEETTQTRLVEQTAPINADPAAQALDDKTEEEREEAEAATPPPRTVPLVPLYPPVPEPRTEAKAEDEVSSPPEEKPEGLTVALPPSQDDARPAVPPAITAASLPPPTSAPALPPPAATTVASAPPARSPVQLVQPFLPSPQQSALPSLSPAAPVYKSLVSPSMIGRRPLPPPPPPYIPPTTAPPASAPTLPLASTPAIAPSALPVTSPTAQPSPSTALTALPTPSRHTIVPGLPTPSPASITASLPRSVPKGYVLPPPPLPFVSPPAPVGLGLVAGPEDTPVEREDTLPFRAAGEEKKAEAEPIQTKAPDEVEDAVMQDIQNTSLVATEQQGMVVDQQESPQVQPSPQGTPPSLSPPPPPPQPAEIHQQHSPTTPQEHRSLTPPLSPFGQVLHGVIEEEAKREQAFAERLKDATPEPLFDRNELLTPSWNTFDEPHARLSASLFDTFRERDERRKDKAIMLRQQYKALNADWKAHVERLDEIRDRVHRRQGGHQQSQSIPQTPSIDSAGLPFYPEPTTPGPSLTGGRSNRRGAGASTLGYGDAVRSEAEFLEILASLEHADLRDPDVRAARTAAVVPDMILDDAERREIVETEFDDERCRVDDPVEAYGVHAPLDVWTEQEVETFCKRYAQHPKQFGKIAQDLPDKSPSQCVLFYYRMKNTIDFRSLSDRRGRDGRRKKAKKRPEEARGGKGSSLLSNLKRPVRAEKAAPVEEEEAMEEDPVPSPKTARSALPPIAESPAMSSSRPLPATNGTDGPQVGTASRRRSVSAATPTSSTATRPQQKTPKLAQPPLPASEGMIEAAEVLGALGVGFDATAASPAPTPAAPEEGKRVQRAAARKVRMDLDDDVDSPPYGSPGGLPLPPSAQVDRDVAPTGVEKGEKTKAKRRSNTSSYWTVAERNEITRLLRLYGKDWKKLAEGLGNKTWVQCRNWYQSNAKKYNLDDVVSAGPLEQDEVEPEMVSPALVHGVHAPPAVPHQENFGHHPLQLPRTGFFDTPVPQLLPPLPSISANPAARPAPTVKAGMQIRNMLNAEGPAEAAASPARDDWFGGGGDGVSATTEDDVDGVANAPFANPSVARQIVRPSSVPYGTQSVATLRSSLPSLLHSTTILPSFSSTLGDRRYDTSARLPSINGHSPVPQSWSRAPASPFPAYASPAASASSITPASVSTEFYRRPYEASDRAPTSRSALPEYFTVKPYERPYPLPPSSSSVFPPSSISQQQSTAQLPPHWAPPQAPPQ
ncbi:hypothetical protein JCM11641_004523 [Rhodosporidiobolus odoratus]